MTRIGIVGAGIVGLSAAYHLLKAGADVILVDSTHPARATPVGAGIISPGTRFINSKTTTLHLVKDAVAYYPELLQQLSLDGEERTGYEVTGGLHIATSDVEAASLTDLLNTVRSRSSDGFSHIGKATILDRSRTIELLPVLTNVVASLHLTESARVDGILLARSLRRACIKRGAVMLVGDAKLVFKQGKAMGIDVNNEVATVDAVIVAAGAWSSRLIRDYFLAPIYPQRGQIVHLTYSGHNTSAWPIVLGYHSHYLLSFPQSRVVIGATREDKSGFNYDSTAGGLLEVLSEATRIAPSLAEASIHEVKVGLRPVTPDQDPVLGQVPECPNLFIAAGHGGYGLQVGPYSGAIVAELALTGSARHDLTPFTLNRFQ